MKFKRISFWQHRGDGLVFWAIALTLAGFAVAAVLQDMGVFYG